MDPNPPIKYEPLGSEASFVKSEPVDDVTSAPLVPASVSSAHAFTPAASPTSSNPWSAVPSRQHEAGPANSPGIPVASYTDSGVQQDQSVETRETASKDTNYLEQLVAQTAPETLESGVEIGINVLDQLKDELSTFQTTEVHAWLETIDALKERAKPTRTVVGVVGNTGAGKSSVINALLDEERLLPTNCLRACTASPTEISYNYSDDPTELYRAEIEFISTEEWVEELKILFTDLLDGNGEVSRECSNADSDAGIAYAKLKAVYPHKTREMIAQGTPETFAKEPAVRGVLGSVKLLKESSAKSLYSRLQHYVDSKEKITGNDHRKRNVPMEYWPLIKVVRIYTKANALSTGAVIVDLPGVQDSNAARAAVAEKYMKSCTGLWIVAPITRAVDDKTAKSLLGDSFRRQLKYDGTYSAVSFICSKTDDISITEAIDSLGLEEEAFASWERAEELKESVEKLQSLLSELKDRKNMLGERVESIDGDYERWEDLLNQLSEGQTVYAPFERKRRRFLKPARSRKNHGQDGSDVDDDQDAYDNDSSDKENSQSDDGRQPLTEEDIEEKLASFRAQRRKVREERRGLDAQIAETRKEIRDADLERQDILAEIKARCIQGRNNYSRGAIKQDFAMGIKELDQEHAAEADDTAFNPDEDLRDYDEVARSLPVFCVSSRAYQKLSGRLQKDDFQSHGFMSVEDTEIPQLQQHAKKLTEAGRASSCRRFLNDLTQLINSMKLWATNAGTRSTLTDVEKRREEMHLRNLLNDLEKGLDDSIKEAVQLLRNSLQEHVYRAFELSIPTAINAAPGIASSWSAPRTMGGLVWATYKATVRRNGVYTGAAGPHDFNQELFDPISRNLATGWDRAFHRQLPAILDGFATKTKTQLKEFHEAAQARAHQRHTNVSGIITLSSQIQAHMRRAGELPTTLRTAITALQREASRKFTPAICDAMLYAYHVCTNERGSGSFNRMKNAMAAHVETSRHTMFHEAINVVKADLEAMCRTVKKQMNDEMEDMFNSIFRDYMKVLVGTTVDRQAKLAPEELAMRAKVNDVLQRSDALFARSLGISDVAASELSPVKEEAPDHAGANYGTQEVEFNSSLAEADEQMQQQIRAQSYDDERAF